MTVGRLDTSVAAEVAAWLLAGAGARVLEFRAASSPFAVPGVETASVEACLAANAVIGVEGEVIEPGARRRPSPIPVPEAGLPDGTLDYATGVALAAATLAGWRTHSAVTVADLDVAIQVFLPEVMAVSYGADPAAARSTVAPQPAVGGGWLSADLGAAGDAERFQTLIGSLPAEASAATLAAAAQEWRLPVSQYQPRPGADLRHPVLATPVRDRSAVPPTSGRSLEGVLVCDLTSMWAGPLATWLLSRLGATVHKIEPAVRLDGTRGLDGAGIYPGGQQTRPGEDSALFVALNRGKERAPLDLRQPRQRDLFLEMAAASDLVIDSFTPRVMTNFGLGPDVVAALPNHPLSFGMPAFPPGPWRQWVAYGTEVHAQSGLGDCGDGSYAAPDVSYPDPVAGLTAAFALVAAIVGRQAGRQSARIEVSLLDATRPLLAFPPSGRLIERAPQAGAALYDAGMAAGSFESVPVAGLNLMHPVGPFRVTVPTRSRQSDEGVVLG